MNNNKNMSYSPQSTENMLLRLRYQPKNMSAVDFCFLFCFRSTRNKNRIRFVYASFLCANRVFVCLQWHGACTVPQCIACSQQKTRALQHNDKETGSSILFLFCIDRTSYCAHSFDWLRVALLSIFSHSVFGLVRPRPIRTLQFSVRFSFRLLCFM